MSDLNGQRVVIAGAAGGIGRQAAALLAAAGATLHLLDIRAPAETREANAACGGIASVHRCDVARRAEVEAIAAQIGPVDVLLDTAGVWPHDDWMAPDWDAAFDRVIDVNLRGPINLVRAFLPGMIERRSGRIVLCGSIAGWTGGLMSSPHYVASKGGIHALVRWFSQFAIPHGVCVNGVAPGPVATPMTQGANHDLRKFPLGRLAEPLEVAHAMVFLCSPGASYVSGTVVDVNGGLYMR
ncbi:SDR family NAD(P)-dependent oxidoreductase [Caballeronia sp. LZ035]|uniref:SDR family NAD(P)-dependent oxidoreductase n=1 Tax=Caballeronia sp. LZ035 TaxID=3038568 RepID=UPI00286105BE|nr:SDR family NAD(P)-dependent oxidoreductase [Caballeronia sp. LZ035]MDR5761328.1 SDR family NAD(P)-dependent oxidoreductase [Caballeronia sp. LZ035]